MTINKPIRFAVESSAFLKEKKKKKNREIESNSLNYTESVLLNTLLFDKSSFNRITTMLVLYAAIDFILSTKRFKLQFSKLNFSDV